MTRRHTPVSPMTGDEVDGILRNIETLLLEREAEAVEEPVQPVPAPMLRPPPLADDQPDLFVPTLCDIPVKDGIGLMDVAVFRLSKSQDRKGAIIRHELSDAVIEVSSGAHGMATVYDYDMVLLTITHLASQVRLYRAGQSPLPSSKLAISGTEILKFCRLPQGGRQYAAIEQALARLQGTFIKIERKKGTSTRRVGYFPLIAGATVTSRTDTGRVGVVELQIPEWIYTGVMNHTTPEILTLNRDYFLIDSGVARFVYRLARKAAGVGDATFSLHTLHERSGTTRAYNKFAYDIRALAARNDLPDYHLRIVPGQSGEMLRMVRRGTDGLAAGHSFSEQEPE
jgi:plasmid replication initiation protein